MKSDMDVIYLAGGCFWGTQHYMSLLYGVIDTEVGYANGNVANPTYQQVYTDQTGHVECVKVTYDRNIISLKTLCRLFFKSIDPLLKNRQGDDCGTRYRTGIYWVHESDKPVINEVFQEVQSKYDVPLAVEILPLDSFYTGEDYHQDYLIKNPDGYCHLPLSLMKTARTYSEVISSLRECSNEEKKLILQDISYEVLEWLLENECHEVRQCALEILAEKKMLKMPGLIRREDNISCQDNNFIYL